jgi:hypothetical protein
VKEPWYCGVDGEQYGPYTWEQMLAMGAEGRLVPETFVRRESDRQWYSAAQIPGLLGRTTPAWAVPPGTAAAPAPSTSVAVASVKPAPASSSSISVGPAARNPPSVPVGTVPVRTVPRGTVPVGTAAARTPTTIEPPAIVVAAPKTALLAGTTPPAMSAPSTADPSTDAANQPKSPWLLAGILAGTALVILMLGAGIVAAIWWQPNDAPVASAQGVADVELASDEEANPAGEQSVAVELTTAQANAAIQPSRSQKLSSRDLAAAKKSIAQQARWTDAQRFGRYRAGKVDLLLVGIWLAADDAGTWVEPVLPDRASSAAGTADEAKYVFVELRLFNSGTVPQKFASWNEAGPMDVVLAHEDGTILPLVPVAHTPNARRLAETRILPGEAIHDLVVFEAPAAPFEKLKLVLAKSALANSLKGHLALEVPVEYLFRRPGRSSAPPAVSAPITARQMPADPGETGLSEPPAITASITSANDSGGEPPSEPAASAKKKGPPSKEELNKLFEEFDKPAAGNAEAPDE